MKKEDYKEQDKVSRELNKITDFNQFPKLQIWKTFSNEEKIEYVKKKIAWNIERMKFIRAVIENSPNVDKLNKKNWDTNFLPSKVITNQLY